MKLTKKQIDIIRANTPEHIKGYRVSLSDRLGYFQKSGANWSYQAGWAKIGDVSYLVVTRFGEVI